MRISRASTRQRRFGVSMTPMIDVVFLLLIFFVCTASFQITELVLPSPLSMAGATAASLPPELQEVELEHVLIRVRQEDRRIVLSVNGQACPSGERLSELLTALVTIDATLPVILDISGETELKAVIDVYDRCRLAGFERVQFAAKVTS